MTTDPPVPNERPPNHVELDVLVLGGGFGGVYCAKRLGKLARKMVPEPLSVGIVSDQNYMVFQPMLAEVAGASISPRHVVNPIRLLCRGVNVYRGEVDDIDPDRKEVRVDTGQFSSDLVIHYKKLVISLGAAIDLSRVPGMPEHAFLMQNVGDAMILRSTILSRIEEANTEHRPEIRKRLLTFVVVGGGYSGVETAGEVLDLVRSVLKFYGGVSESDVRVVLVHSRDRLLQNLSESLGHYAADKLIDRGLEVRLEERVRAVTAARVYLKSGETIETNTVVSTVGNAPNPAIVRLCESHDIAHHQSWIQTNECLQVKHRDDVWAIGDCANNPLYGKEGERCPQTAQFAMRMGTVAADNVVKSIRSREQKPFTFQGLGELASIGHHTAVAHIGGVNISGFIAWFMWRTIYLAKLPGLDRKVRVMIDWTLDLFFPRDINLLNPRYTSLFRQVHLEANDTLFNRGEPAFSLYVVKKGSIELRNADDGVVRTIESGDFFGERALVHGGGYLYNAIAPEETELVSLSGEAVLPFFEASRRFRRVLAKTTAQGSAEGELKALIEKLDRNLLEKPVTEIMRRDIATLKIDETVGDALSLFKKRRFSIYPLVSDDGHLVGILNREDFFDFIKRDKVTRETSLDQIEFMHLPTCRDTVTVEDALMDMVQQGRYKCLITSEEGKLLGIIAAMDLIGESIKAEA